MNCNTVTPKLSFYHPNAKGTGAAIQFELRPAHGMTDGAIYCRIAPQKSVGDRTANPPTFPTFDWDNNITVKFDFTDVCKILQVLRGECETVEEGKGIYHLSASKTITIKFEHIFDRYTCYRMTFIERKRSDGEEASAIISFSTAEALGLAEVFAGSLKEIAFGTSFEATSIAIARDQEIERQAAEIAANEAKKAREEEETNACEKAVAKTDALMMLSRYYGEQYRNQIADALDRACDEGGSGVTDDEYRLGVEALGKANPIFKFVKRRNNN